MRLNYSKITKVCGILSFHYSPNLQLSFTAKPFLNGMGLIRPDKR